jgi:predicted MFS family arabinose efflux permease
LIFSGTSIGLFLSPAPGGWIAARLGTPITFMISSLSFLLAAIPLTLMSSQTVYDRHAIRDKRSLIKNRRLVRTISFTLILLTVMYLGQVLTPNYLESNVGYGIEEVGRFGTAAALGAIIFNLILGNMRTRNGLIISQIGMLLSMLILLTVPETPLIWLAYLFFGLFTTTNFIMVGMMASYMKNAVSGFAYGVQAAMMGLAIVMSSAAAGVLYQISSRVPYYTVVLGLLIVIPLSLNLPLDDA